MKRFILLSLVAGLSIGFTSNASASERRFEIRKWAKRVSGESKAQYAGMGFMMPQTDTKEVEKTEKDTKKTETK